MFNLFQNTLTFLTFFGGCPSESAGYPQQTRAVADDHVNIPTRVCSQSKALDTIL